MTNTYCATCPLKGSGTPCLGAVDPGGFGYFCEWSSEGDPLKGAHIAARSAVATGAAPPVPPAVPLGPPPVPLAGDLVEAAAHRIGADRLAQWVAAKLGKDDCGCAGRRDRMNALDAKLRHFLRLR